MHRPVLMVTVMIVSLMEKMISGEVREHTKLSASTKTMSAMRTTVMNTSSNTSEPTAAAPSNWSVFDVVQRLPGREAQTLKFALLEEMDLLKPGQRRAFREEKQVELGGRRVRLRGYHQIGRGVLPWLYWVDESGRLLLAYSGVRAFLYDAQAEQWTNQKRQAARNRARKGRRTP